MFRLRQMIVTSVMSLLPISVAAQDQSLSKTFEDHAAKHPRYALTAAYASAADAPTIMTAGPMSKSSPVAVPNDAKWHVGSITKSFTASLVMRLVERGMLDLDTPVAQYLERYHDGMHPDWKAPTLRQLLSHTSGLPANAPRALTRKTYSDDAVEGRRTVLSAMWDTPASGKIGDYEYSNIGYVLAGLVIEEVIGTSWEKAIRTEIAAPLGLSSLGFGAPREADAPRGNQSTFGIKRAVEPESVHSDNPKWLGPAGTIHMSMADLVKWGQLHVQACAGNRPDFLSPESCRTMQRPVVGEYGLGWVVQDSDTVGSPVIWHNGSNTMWYAVLSMVPAQQIVLAVATNAYVPARMDQLTLDLLETLVPDS